MLSGRDDLDHHVLGAGELAEQAHYRGRTGFQRDRRLRRPTEPHTTESTGGPDVGRMSQHGTEASHELRVGLLVPEDSAVAEIGRDDRPERLKGLSTHRDLVGAHALQQELHSHPGLPLLSDIRRQQCPTNDVRDGGCGRDLQCGTGFHVFLPPCE